MIHALLHSLEGGGRTGGEGATDGTGRGQRGQAPGGSEHAIAAEGCGAEAEIGEVFAARQQAEEQGQQLGRRRLMERLLGDGHGEELLDQREGAREVAPGDEQGMLGRLGSSGGRRR